MIFHSPKRGQAFSSANRSLSTSMAIGLGEVWMCIVSTMVKAKCDVLLPKRKESLSMVTLIWLNAYSFPLPTSSPSPSHIPQLNSCCIGFCCYVFQIIVYWKINHSCCVIISCMSTTDYYISSHALSHCSVTQQHTGIILCNSFIAIQDLTKGNLRVSLVCAYNLDRVANNHTRA